MHYVSTTEKSLPLPLLSDSTRAPKEWAVLLECASPACDSRRLAELSGSMDWSQLLVLAEEHGVLGHVAVRLGALENALVPAEVRATLVEHHRAQVFSTLRLTGELFHVLELFAAKGIAALAVKGPVLAMHAYGDPAMRSYGDLDLLVRQRDICLATECLQSDDFAPTVSVTAINAGKIPGQYLFSKPKGNLLLELHNDFTLRYFPRPLPLETLFARSTLVPIDGRDVPALTVEDELVYICVHGATHFWDRLGWIADVAALVTRQTAIDWESVGVIAKEVEAERMLHTGLLLASDVLNIHLPEKVLKKMREDAGAAKLAMQVRTWMTAADKRSPTLYERAAFRLLMRGSGFSALSYLLRLSLSPTEEDWKQEDLGKRRSILAAMRRPFRLMRKYGPGGKF